MRPIDNCGVLDRTGFVNLIAEIYAEVASGRPFDVPCAHGFGRTGAVIGVWLRRCRGHDDECIPRLQ